MPSAVKIEEHFVDTKFIHVAREGDNQYVGFLANALHLAARDGYRLTDARENGDEVVLKFERGKHDKPAPVMRKRP